MSPLGRPLRYGMIGGGPGAFIGDVHRAAIRLDGLADLVAGAFSSDPAKSGAQGRALGLDPARVYGSFEAMAEAEAARPEGQRLDFVVVVTPNHLHAPVCHAFLDRGFHVVCDKPLTTTLEDAEALCRRVAETGRVFALTHNYAGYPLVKQARAMVAGGELGPIRKVVVEYAQGWLATPVEQTGSKQAAWRTDPAQAGAGALGDIGTHAEHLARYVTGLEVAELCADVSTFVEGRRVDDDASVLLRFDSGAKGVLCCSQVAVGEENGLRLRVYGTTGALAWRQEAPNALLVRALDGPDRVLRRGHDFLAPAAQRATRLPPGHPEGFLEAFASVYSPALRTIAAHQAGTVPDPLDLDLPTVQDGARGVHFIETALASHRQKGWVNAAYTPPGPAAPSGRFAL